VTRKQECKDLKTLIQNAEITRDKLEEEVKNEKVASEKWSELYKKYSYLVTKITIWNRQLEYLTKGHGRLGESISFIKVSKQN